MRKRRVLLSITFVSCSLWGCSDSDTATSSGAGGSSTGTSRTTSTTSAATTTTTTTSGPSTSGSSAGSDGGGGGGGGGGDGSSLEPANPPAGYSPCGSGTFTQADAHAACTGIGSFPKACDAVTISGGRWEAWCAPDQRGLYVWAEFDDAAEVASSVCVPVFFGGGYSIPGGAGAGGTPHQVQYPPSPNLTYEFELSFAVARPSGSGTFAASALLGAGYRECLNTGLDAQFVTGFDMAWQ